MKTSELLLSSLNITEDDYSYKGLFILNDDSKSLQMDMSDLENDSKIADLKAYFNLEENTSEIKKTVMEMIFDKVSISSVITEGENFEENSRRKIIERRANSFDLA